MTTINNRIKELITELFSSNKTAFSKAIGVSPTVTENIVGKRQSSPSYELLKKIVDSIENINHEWLLTGEGSMFKQYIVSEDQPLYGKKALAKPFIDASSFTDNSFSSSMQDAITTAIIPFVGDYDFSLRVYGDSMHDEENLKRSINDQDVVVCKLRKSQSYIRWGEIYALATSEGYTVKKIIQSELKDYVRCISFNEENGYKPYDQPLAEISEWAIVIAIVSIKNI